MRRIIIKMSDCCRHHILQSLLIGMSCCFIGCVDSTEKINVSGPFGETRPTVVINQVACILEPERYCYEACPKRAINILKKDTTVFAYVIDPVKCTNCGMCIAACPYGAIEWRK